MTINEVAEELGVKVSTVKKLISDGLLDASRPITTITKASLTAYLRTKRDVGRPQGVKDKKPRKR